MLMMQQRGMKMRMLTSSAMMRRSRITKESLQGKPGEVVTVNALPARDGTKTLAWISRITYADGHFLQLAGQ